jgi:signal transduction histidine kinase
MLTGITTTPDHAPAMLAADMADAQLVGAMRLVLAVSVLLASLTEPISFHAGADLAWMLFAVYVAHSLLLYAVALARRPLAASKLQHWLDVLWYAVFVAMTGGSRSLLFLFFFFAILSSSFRWGFEEGARVTVVATALFAATALFPGASPDLPRLLLRSCFMLTLGYISAYWGESKIVLNRRLALLRDVSQWSNPRFGVDHTITQVLEQTRHFFQAQSCVLVLRDRQSGSCQMRTVRADRTRQPVNAQAMGSDAAEPLLALPPQAIVYQRSRRILARQQTTLMHDTQLSVWAPAPCQAAGERIADLLEGDSFISVPVSLRRTQGRLFVVNGRSAARKADALFLGQLTAQAFPVIETIELVDNMASEAAFNARQKMALDIHDRAVQPYIGLTLGLSALRNKAAPTNPLLQELDKLGAVARQAIEDLRCFAGTFRQTGGPAEAVFATALRQQTAQIRALYGVDIAVSTDPDLQMNDRMGMEVLQIVREGLSNICRHTLAQRGALRMQLSLGCLHIQIENTGAGEAPPAFSPRSITERVTALGGQVKVRAGADGGTSVQIQIPV